MIKTILLWLLAAISILSCSSRKELKSINPPLGLKWNMSMDEARKIANRHGMKFKKIELERSEAPEYLHAEIKGPYLKSDFYMVCWFWSDSLFGLEIYSHLLNIKANKRIFDKILDKTARYNMVNNIQIDTIKPSIKVNSQCMAMDSSRLIYSTHHLINASEDYMQYEAGRIEFRSANYLHFSSCSNAYRNEYYNKFKKGR